MSFTLIKEAIFKIYLSNFSNRQIRILIKMRKTWRKYNKISGVVLKLSRHCCLFSILLTVEQIVEFDTSFKTQIVYNECVLQFFLDLKDAWITKRHCNGTGISTYLLDDFIINFCYNISFISHVYNYDIIFLLKTKHE